jgi:hypothetical protein
MSPWLPEKVLTVLNPPGSQVMLAGPSDAGLADPGICAAKSAPQTTTNLIAAHELHVLPVM